MQRLFRQFCFPAASRVTRAGDARLDPRGRRARLRALPRLRRGLRQSRSLVARSSATAKRRRGRSRRLAPNKFLDPVRRRRRAADPASERLQDRQPLCARAYSARRAREPLRGYGYDAVLRRRRRRRHAPAMAAAIDEATAEIRASSAPRARAAGERPRWPMIVLRSPKGWTGPRSWTASPSRARGARIKCLSASLRKNRSTSHCSSRGCAATRREELFDATGKPLELSALAPRASDAWARTRTRT